MAINDVSLTAGMRSNLLALQNTVDLLDRTQSRLATGKKVNTAIDNPVSFFASQALTSRASVIDSLKDAMGQAVQTINAADRGITAVNALIEQAKGIAQSALSADLTLTAEVSAVVTLDISTIADDETVIINAQTFTSSTGGAGSFQGAEELAGLIDAMEGYSATFEGNVVTITVAAEFTADDITGTFAVAGANVTAYDAGGAPRAELASLIGQYDTIRAQLDTLVADSGYKGINLLGGTSQILSVKFEGDHRLDVVGFDASTTGLGIGAATGNWTSAAAINASVTALDGALETLRSESSKLSGNLSIITVRQDFSTNMINTLIEGADKLTLADANEEGANMLMLQTRQSLSTTALSMSAQAAQSVLRLFQ